MFERVANDEDGAALARMRDRLREEQRRVRTAAAAMVISVPLALLSGWLAVHPAQSFAMRCLMAVTLVFIVVVDVSWARRFRMGWVCRKSYQWHVNYMEREEK
ncbi:hypothetical protein [Streptomyces sp. NBC_01304]|uniref:hypothetical protein n=1 Tax=Streptomyces sp. NBC_01304 TaxID=2903818 RepID=UPI002E0E0E93|nr:hypothetical protein OG430_49100 [Streptomyces sp. NBC_01304]